MTLSARLLLCFSLLVSSTLAIAGKPSPADRAVQDFDLPGLAAQLRTLPAGPEHYFAGILASRLNQNAEAVRLLTSALPSLRATRPGRAALALQALADAYNRQFDYPHAASAYNDLLAHLASSIPHNRLRGTHDDAEIARILANAHVPPQTVTWTPGKTVQLPIARNPIGSYNATLTVNGVSGSWLLDTGANQSGLTRSFAKRLGLTLLPGIAHTGGGVTGIENPLRIAILPTLSLGGATLHNVPVLILDDRNLHIGVGKLSYQIQAILGYNAFQSLGNITFAHNRSGLTGTFSSDPHLHLTTGARVAMRNLDPVLECRVHNQDLPFTFDTGASGTNLSVRYFQRFHSLQPTWKKSDTEEFGAGGNVRSHVDAVPRLTLVIGSRTATLRDVTLYPKRMHSGIDELYGNLGQDLLAPFRSFTLDLDSMRFTLGPSLTR